MLIVRCRDLSLEQSTNEFFHAHPTFEMKVRSNAEFFQTKLKL